MGLKSSLTFFKLPFDQFHKRNAWIQPWCFFPVLICFMNTLHSNALGTAVVGSVAGPTPVRDGNKVKIKHGFNEELYIWTITAHGHCADRGMNEQ